MASIYKSPRSQNWLAAFRNDTGKRQNRSTAIRNLEKNRSKALRIAEEFEAVARKQKSAAQVKATLSDLLISTGLSAGEEILSISLRDYTERFIKLKSVEVGASSISSYKKSFDDLIGQLGDRADSVMDSINYVDLKDYRLNMIANFAPKTAARKLKAVKTMFKSAHDEGYLMADPSIKLKTSVKAEAGDGTETTKRAFTIDEIRRISENASDEWRSMIYFGLYTGQRLGDLATLRWSNLDLAKKVFNVSTNKTGRTVQIPFSDTLLDHILTLDAPDDPLAYVHPQLAELYTQKNGSSSVSNQFADLLALCGLREPVSHESRGIGRSGKRTTHALGFHCLRATAVTLLHEAGIPQATVQEWVGHNSKEVHALYIKLGEESAKKASQALPRI